MKLSVLALDYDGTLTRDGRPHPLVLAAVAQARRRNITVILVTGRILEELRRVAGRDMTCPRRHGGSPIARRVRPAVKNPGRRTPCLSIDASF